MELRLARSTLPVKAALIKCHDDDFRVVSMASGFIAKHHDGLYVYTCWHVVTGYDKNDIRIGHELPNRRHIQVEMMQGGVTEAGHVSIGGVQLIGMYLYEPSSGPGLGKPVWEQDTYHTPHQDLNSVGLFVPTFHDTVRIKIPDNVKIHDWQLINSDSFRSPRSATIGDKVFVVGYPYGYSAFGSHNPTAIALTRFVASTRFSQRTQEFLLESPGAPSMSGGPVFVEHEGQIHFCGQYTGLIYPDHIRQQNDKTTALGTCVDLSQIFQTLAMTKNPVAR